MKIEFNLGIKRWTKIETTELSVKSKLSEESKNEIIELDSFSLLDEGKKEDRVETC